MTGLDDDPRGRVLHVLQRQIEYLRYKPDSRLRVIARLEALPRIAHTHQQLEDNSPLGYLFVNVRKFLPGQIKILKSGARNDARMILGASLFVRCAQSEQDLVDTFDLDIKEISVLDMEEDFPLDEDDLTRVLFGF
ncbi:unnamed protein product [Penicillium bialowiezense]